MRVVIPALVAGLVVLAASTREGGQVASAAGKAAAKQTRPNVIVIETDDQSVETLRVMKNVRQLIGAQGATFENSFASYALCCPSRATFLTGQYAHNHGVRGNTPPAGGYEKLDHSSTLAVWLKRAGYHTAHIGKYLNGYGKKGAEREIPAGWSEWHGGINLSFVNHSLNQNGKIVSFSGEENYQTDVYARIAQDLIRRRAPKAQPFFVWLNPHAPHGGGPAEPDDPRGIGTTRPAARHRDVYAREPLPQPPSFNEQDVSDKPAAIRNRPPLSAQEVAGIREAYQQQLESLLSIDEAVGKIVAELRRAGELGNTLVIFTSDNGFFHGEHRVPAGKVLVYEPSIRVPLLMRGPGVRPGVRPGALVANIDLAPTIMDAANAKAGRKMDGRSLLAILRKPSLVAKRDLLIETGPSKAERGDVGTPKPPRKGRGKGKKGNAGGDRSFTAIRTARYVYVEYAGGERELYDLASDPHELTSRHADPALENVRTDLARRLARLRACAGAGCQ